MGKKLTNNNILFLNGIVEILINHLSLSIKAVKGTTYKHSNVVLFVMLYRWKIT